MMATRIKEKYQNEVVPALQQKFGYKNVMQIPKLDKIVINMGLGDCKDNPKSMELAIAELAQISGQKPLITKARKSIANFKLREGMNVAATDRFLLYRNYFTEFHPNYAKGEHPDTVQFWNVNETAGVSNAKLIENVMIHGGCRAVQGFFLGAERAAYWHSNLEIRGNVFYGSLRTGFR